MITNQNRHPQALVRESRGRLMKHAINSAKCARKTCSKTADLIHFPTKTRCRRPGHPAGPLNKLYIIEENAATLPIETSKVVPIRFEAMDSTTSWSMLMLTWRADPGVIYGPESIAPKSWIGTTSPGVSLDVNGGIRPGSTAAVTACGSGQGSGEGTTRYNYTSHNMEYCNGTTWVAFVSASSGQLHQQIFNASGTFTLPAGTSTSTVYKITLVGGGGGGSNAVGGTSQTAGSASSIVWNGTTVTAGGGSAANTNAVNGGAGGVASNGTLNINGQAGGGYTGSSGVPTGFGGSSTLGAGGNDGSVNGSGYGGGGAGAYANGGYMVAGGGGGATAIYWGSGLAAGTNITVTGGAGGSGAASAGSGAAGVAIIEWVQ